METQTGGLPALETTLSCAPPALRHQSTLLAYPSLDLDVEVGVGLPLVGSDANGLIAGAGAIGHDHGDGRVTLRREVAFRRRGAAQQRRGDKLRI